MLTNRNRWTKLKKEPQNIEFTDVVVVVAMGMLIRARFGYRPLLIQPSCQFAQPVQASPRTSTQYINQQTI